MSHFNNNSQREIEKKNESIKNTRLSVEAINDLLEKFKGQIKLDRTNIHEAQHVVIASEGTGERHIPLWTEVPTEDGPQTIEERIESLINTTKDVK